MCFPKSFTDVLKTLTLQNQTDAFEISGKNQNRCIG